MAEISFADPAEIRISGSTLSAGGPILAEHTGGAWHVGAQRLERIVCKGTVRVQFESKAGCRSVGPCDGFSLTDDLAMTTQGVLARYQPVERTWNFSRAR